MRTKTAVIRTSLLLSYVVSLYALMYAIFTDWSLLIYFGLGLIVSALFVMDNVRNLVRNE